MTDEPLPLPSDAPFGITSIPTGWDRVMTQDEADEFNLMFPVPPYGKTFFPNPPPEPPLGSDLKFVKLSNIDSLDSNVTRAQLRPGDAEKLVGHDTITLWPLSGRSGIFDDLPARAVHVRSVVGDMVEVGLDTDGLNVAGLTFLGVLYDPS